MQLIDKYLPAWDFAKRNDILLKATAPPIASVVYKADFSKSKIIKALFFLRGLPARMLTIDGFIETGFIILSEQPNEVVIGLVAQPWKLKGNVLKMSSEEFVDFNESDFLKVVWNFRFEQRDEERVSISTETRIHCTSDRAKKQFSMYWFVIGFFSGIIRNEMLKIIRNEVV